jgi:hypothetical protein
MTVDEFIEQIKDQMAHGLPPGGKLLAFDGDTEDVEEVTGFLTAPNGDVELCTDVD